MSRFLTSTSSRRRSKTSNKSPKKRQRFPASRTSNKSQTSPGSKGQERFSKISPNADANRHKKKGRNSFKLLSCEISVDKMQLNRRKRPKIGPPDEDVENYQKDESDTIITTRSRKQKADNRKWTQQKQLSNRYSHRLAAKALPLENSQGMYGSFAPGAGDDQAYNSNNVKAVSQTPTISHNSLVIRTRAQSTLQSLILAEKDVRVNTFARVARISRPAISKSTKKRKRQKKGGTASSYSSTVDNNGETIDTDDASITDIDEDASDESEDREDDEKVDDDDDASDEHEDDDNTDSTDDAEATAEAVDDEEDGILKSEIPTNVVKVYCTHCWPSFSYPWSTAGQTHSSSTGFVWSAEEGSRLLLTNAHSVQYAAVIQVRKRGDHQKYEAKVVCVGYDCDLALLTVEEDEFWTDMRALCWGRSPRLEDPVTVVGYPVGGDNTSVTQGVVSRIDFQRYTVGSCNLLAIQIDAAINGGNSGGPALNRAKECVGIAFQSLKDSETENIGYIIPCEVVFHFMEDYNTHGKYTGFGSCPFIWQKAENKCIQVYYGIKERGKGVLISKIDKTSPAYGHLKKGDIVLSIDDSDIATDGTVPFTNGERIAFEWLLCQKFVGQSIRFSVLRNKREKEVILPVVRAQPLVPTYLPEDEKPQYFIAGGLVFIPLTELFLTSEYGQDCICRAPGQLITASNRPHKEFEDEQIVVIGHVLAHEITVGYEDYSHYCVREFNGQSIKNLRHLVTLVESSTDEYWRFDLDNEMVIILNAEAARNSLSDILKQNMIPAAKSAHLPCES